MKTLSLALLSTIVLSSTAFAGNTVEKVKALSNDSVSMGLIEGTQSVYDAGNGTDDANVNVITTYCGGAAAPLCISAVVFDPSPSEGDGGTWETFKILPGTGSAPSKLSVKRLSKSLISLQFETSSTDYETESTPLRREKVIANFTVSADGQIGKVATVKRYSLSN